MPRFDPELIAALAEGTIDPARAETLEREIAADPAATAELAAQRAALSAIAEAEQPTLLPAERDRIRSAIATELGIVTAAEEAPQSRRIPWGSVAIAAASLVGVVAVVPVVGLLSAGGDDASGSIAAEAATTAPAATQDLDLGATSFAEEMPTAGAERDSAETTEQDDGFFDTSATTTVPTTTTAPTATTALPVAGTLVPSDDLLTRIIERLPDDPRAASVADEGCNTAARELFESDAALFAHTERLDEIDVIAYYLIDTDGVRGPVAVFDLADCSLIGSNG